jgi:hypothetical protein
MLYPVEIGVRLSRSIFVVLAAVAASGCASESLYWTQPSEKPMDNYVFLAPYFADVRNRITVTIAQAATSKLPDSSMAAGSPTVSIGMIPVPVSRSFIFMKRNGLFSNSANVSLSSVGLLSGSDTASQQQITAILTELAQTAGVVARPGFAPGPEVPGLQGRPPPASDRDKCFAGIKNLVSGLPYVWSNDNAPAGAPYDLAPLKDAANQVVGRLVLSVTIPSGIQPRLADVGQGHSGIVAFFPVPAAAELRCVLSSGTSYALAAPAMLNLYLDSEFLDPQRDFLTGPQDTFTFADGFLTGHKYADQSPAKTVVDTVTAPIRAFLPSVSVTQSTQVQTGGGKPDQTTNTTSTTTGPPKGP